MHVILAWLREHDPDVFCVQETKVRDEEFPAAPLVDAGYNVAFRGQKGYSGVAMISKRKPSDVRFGFDGKGPADADRLLYARLGPLHVVNTYVPQGRDIDHDMYRYKLRWFKRLRSFFDGHFSTRMQVVWVGDLNVAPEPMDVHNPDQQKNHVCFHAEVRRAFERTAGWGFSDVFRKHHPEPGRYSYFDYRTRDAVKRGMGWRVDHILATAPLARKSRDAWIDIGPRLRDKPSDHTVVAADFDIGG